MKSLRYLLPIALLLFCGVAFAQSDAQKSFDQLKTLAGDWQGPVTVDPPQPDMKGETLMQISLRVTSRGNALVHEMQEAGKPLDATKYDHPVTMFYLDGRPLESGPLLRRGQSAAHGGAHLRRRQDRGV
jgi:hypothetical protein